MSPRPYDKQHPAQPPVTSQNRIPSGVTLRVQDEGSVIGGELYPEDYYDGNSRATKAMYYHGTYMHSSG